MLPRRERIARGSEIRRILNRKKFHFSSPLLFIAADENNKPYSRLAVICSRELGTAVERNRVRRIIFGQFRKIRQILAKKVDAVIIPRFSMASAKEYGDEIHRGLCG